MNLLPRSVAAWLLSATLSTPALAADPSTSALLKDIHALQRATLHSASGMTPMGGTLFFNHTDSRTGSELWRTDGTPGGTALVKDLAPGLYGSHPDDFIEARGSLFFSTARSFEGSELWKTDGTAAGTVRLKHLGEAALADREIVGSTYYFVLESSDTGYHELWKSDGTAAGTTRVTDLGKGSQRVRLQYLKAVGGTLYFVASYPDRHEELWKSDGTEAGTVLVRSGVGLGSFVRFSNLMDLGGTLVLGVISGGMSQLWKSDGTGAGTVKLADIPMTPQEYALGNGRLFFIAGDALWTSDGTPAGTVSLKFFTNVQARSLVVRNGVLFLSASDDASSDTPRLWKSDGTPGGTTRVLDLPLSDGYAGMALAQGTLFFVGREATTDSLWKSDGTPAGTVKLKELTTDEAPRVYMMTAAGGNVFFQHTVTTSAEPELWKSDGTAAGTGPVHKAPAEPLGSNASRWTQLGNSLLFFANDGVHGFEPWKTEGTADSTVLLKDTEPADALATFGQSASRFVVRDTTAFFLSMSESTQRLWKTDGTGAGTVLVKEFPYTRFSSPMESDLVLIGQTLYFAAQDAAHGTELWKSDGTPEGTVLVKDVHAGTESGTGSWLRHVNGTLLFLADDGVHGVELWKSDGTEAGTVLVKDVRPGTEGSIEPSPWTLATTTGALYFTADDGVHGVELWKSDGTEAGTVLVKDVRPGSDGADFVMRATGGTLYFTVDDGVHGFEPWKSDGSESGTFMLKDIHPGPASSYGLSFQQVGSSVLFFAYDAAHGFEPWKTDGTEAGTVLLKDVLPGPQGSSFLETRGSTEVLFPEVFPVEELGFALFSASDGEHGSELWRTDGTPEGTTLYLDLVPGADSSSPRGFARFGDRLVFTATDGTSGREPHLLPVTRVQPEEPQPSVVEEPPTEEEKEGCGCAAGSSTGASAVWSLLALLAGVTLRRRRA